MLSHMINHPDACSHENHRCIFGEAHRHNSVKNYQDRITLEQTACGTFPLPELSPARAEMSGAYMYFEFKNGKKPVVYNIHIIPSAFVTSCKVLL